MKLSPAHSVTQLREFDLHSLTQPFQADVKQEADVGHRQARDFRNFAIAEFVLKFQPNDVLLAVRQAVELLKQPSHRVLLFGRGARRVVSGC